MPLETARCPKSHGFRDVGFHGRRKRGLFLCLSPHPFADDSNRKSPNPLLAQDARGWAPSTGEDARAYILCVIMCDLDPGLAPGAALFRSFGAGFVVRHFICSPLN